MRRWSLFAVLAVLSSPALADSPAVLSKGAGLQCNLAACADQSLCASGPTACLELTCPETAWRVCVEDKGLKGLWVGPAEFKRTAESNWMRVLKEAGLTEVFVPYHLGSLRLYDMRSCSTCLRQVFPEDAGRDGSLVRLAGQPREKVVAEVRDRGIAWLCSWIDGSGVEHARSRRGEELVVWGVYDATNYDYIIQYAFRDDGGITFRMGATGYNYPRILGGRPGGFAAHMHNALWRVDVDLNGPADDSAFVVNHRENVPALTAIDRELPFNNGREGAFGWNPRLFNTVVIEDEATTNVHGNHIGYAAVPFRQGTARHTEPFTRHDFWITRRHPDDLDFIRDNSRPDDYLLGLSDRTSGIANREPIQGQDIVLWHSSPAHHHPHDEDQAPGDSDMKGLTLVHWMGFDLEPHNLFDYNPLGGPHRNQCDGLD